MIRKLSLALALFLAVSLGASCATMKQAVKTVGRMTGNETLEKGGETDLEPKEEHYIGRAIAANVLTASPVSAGTAQAYVNYLGQYLAAFSSRPSLFVGYRVGLIESPTPTAISTPGGFIFVSTGFLRQMDNEDALAGVVAHEVAHIAQRHTEKTLRRTRDLQAGVEAAKGIANLAGLGMSDDNFKVVEEAFTGGTEIVMKKGVGKAYEIEADVEAVRILVEAGYDPAHYRAFVLSQSSQKERSFSTHPSGKDRIEAIDRAITSHKARIAKNGFDKRKDRFKNIQAKLMTNG
jgi:predicted Zn-dependent protease